LYGHRFSAHRGLSVGILVVWEVTPVLRLSIHQQSLIPREGERLFSGDIQTTRDSRICGLAIRCRLLVSGN
jgi:hypothetical protein